MGRPGPLWSGLGSRFALRTYLLFCLCALVPVGIFGAIGYIVVSSELRTSASQRLSEASKHYGLLLNDRLIQAEKALAELARVQIVNPGVSQSMSSSDARLSNVVLKEVAGAYAETGREAATFSVSPTLRISSAADPVITMMVTVQSGTRQILATADLMPADLWDADAVTLAGMSLCAYAAGRQLTCTDPDQSEARGGIDEELLHEHWALFLRPRYGVDEWTIEARQPASIALKGLGTFQNMLLGAAALACLAALLVSAIQIRRSHRPLAELVEAARLMGARRFDTRVRLKGRGEFAQLGRAFNGLAAGLQRQFRILRAFSRIDRHILANPEVEPLVRTVLPRVARLLHAQVILLAVQDPDDKGCSIHFCTAAMPQVVAVRRIAGNSLAGLLEQPGDQWQTLAESAGDQHFHWTSAAIIVGNTLRGVIAAGRPDVDAARQEDARHLQGLARRLAVALTNEDRERALVRQAYYDSLTLLPNRQLFKDRLEQEAERSISSGSRVVLFFIDLDHFKHVNDSLGHSAGDDLLRAAAERLNRLLRPGDTLARLGGDEFTLIAPDLDDAHAEILARRMIEAVSQPFQLGGMQCVVQASIGIAVCPRDSRSAEELLRNADTAMYRAKSQGRGRAVFFEENMNARAVRRLMLEQRLRLAVQDRSMRLHYQPKFAAASGKLMGVEALARWKDELHGEVSPAEFIPLAEESGLIDVLGAWCLREACAVMRGWRARNLDIPHVAVNVSMQQLRNREFPGLVKSTLRDHGLQPADLEIEITESMLAGDVAEVAGLIAAIRNLGVRVAIDDFGTGYSSMVALQQFPADVVKIDRTFVAECVQPQGLALLRALIAAGHALGKEVVAEGVETEEQLAILRALRCDLVQGYLLAPPRPAEDLERGLVAQVMPDVAPDSYLAKQA